MPRLKLILGSSSRWRLQVFKKLRRSFQVMVPDVDEKAIRHEDPQELVRLLAQAKSEAIQRRLAGAPAVIVTSDQVVLYDGQVREKPQDEAEAREFIRTAHEHPSSTVTSVMVVNTATGRQALEVDVATIWFKRIPQEVEDALIAKGDVMDCAGGFEHEEPLVQPYILKIEGEGDSIKGLPLKLTRRLLKEVMDSQ